MDGNDDPTRKATRVEVEEQTKAPPALRILAVLTVLARASRGLESGLNRA